MIRRNSDIEIQLPDAGPTPLSPESVTESDVEMLAEEQAPPLSLPPHIAARFYRKSSIFRRSSAASSRRNSVSSLHSHNSASSNGSPTPDHIAQHLRRTSILENRKARLADRALHGEKVRLRAALAKAATRNLQIEERALAAQQARERLLADITAKCEDQVKRAKKKAEDQRDKKAAEEARLRVEMAEKFAEAEKRRTLYQQTHRRQRTSSLPVAAEKKMSREITKSFTQDAAARKIQRVWKTHNAKMVMKQFQSLNLSVNRVRNETFEQVGRLLSNKELLETMTKVLRLCGLQDMEGGTMGERGAVRTFLSSYLIVTHPTEVLSSSNGEQEQDLIDKAGELLAAFDQVTALLSSGCCSPSVITADLQTLCERHNVFFSAFHAWKSHDSSVLIEIMIAQFVELELIWQTVKNDQAGGAAEDYRQGIRQNQILLLARLKRLAGPDRHMELIRDSLKKAKREKKRAASKQAIPRSAEAVPPSADVLTESVTSPISESFNNLDFAVLHELDKQRTSPHERFTKILTPLPENRELVHELLINKEFKIEEAPYTEPRREIMKQMCETMRQGVEAGQATNWIVAMATVIQDRLLRSLQRGNSLYVIISEVLDPKLVQGQCEAGTFSYDNFFEFMNNILPRLCAPYRDPVVKAFIEDTSGDEIDRLARLMSIIDLLSLDQTNFMIQLAAPQLIEEAPGYEQRTFDRGIADGTISVRKTRRFWRTHHKIIVDEMKKRDPEKIHGEPRPHSARVYAQGLADTVLSNAIVSEDLIPETLSLDRQRLERLHARAFQIVATASILLTAKNLLKRDVRSQWKPEADRILSLDFNEISAERVQSILESTHPMPPAASAQLAATIKRVLGPVATACIAAAPQLAVVSSNVSASEMPSTDSQANAPSFSDPVARLMLSRLRSHVLSRLSASSASERVRATTTASQNLAAAGMPEFVNEVGQVVEELEKVREVDWLCHGAVYQGLYEEGVLPQ